MTRSTRRPEPAVVEYYESLMPRVDGSLRYRWACDSPRPERYTFELWLARGPAGSRPTA